MRKAVNMQQLIIKNIIFELIRFNFITPRPNTNLGLFQLYITVRRRTSFFFINGSAPPVKNIPWGKPIRFDTTGPSILKGFRPIDFLPLEQRQHYF